MFDFNLYCSLQCLIFNLYYTLQCLTLACITLSNVDKDRKRILERKARSRQVADKGKHTEEYIMETTGTCGQDPMLLPFFLG
jgi:hypothetical protein